ncbi:hypothetical protein HPB50_001394 [Hyalomma asiaticum]|uniref:Uncharacterized protein n=1 Tax=Hyalomma asiaticum TaxID=266040 RepID=A0ACB7SAY8_HYAAI|nr:hypothetical protein HPB50_001394 [Hyalomma asiaticum]
MERCLLVSVGFLTVIAIVLIATTSMAMARPKALKKASQELSTEVCNSTVCHERDILEKAPYKVDGQNVTDQVVLAYHCCTNESISEETKYAALRAMFSSVGIHDWPRPVGWLEAPSWEELFVQAYTKTGLSFIMATGVGVDLKNTSVYVISFDQPGFGIGRNQLINMTTPNNEPIVRAYKKYMAGSIRFMQPSLSDSAVDAVVEDIINFESQLARRTRSPEDRRVFDTMYNRRTVANLSAEFPQASSLLISLRAQREMRKRGREKVVLRFRCFSRTSLLAPGGDVEHVERDCKQYALRKLYAFRLREKVDWLTILNRIFEPINLTMTEEEDVVMREPEYYNSTLDFLKTVEGATIYNYVGWRLMQNFGPTSSKLLRKLEFDFVRVVQGVEKILPIWQRCIGSISALLDHPMGRLYIDKEFSPQAKEDMDSLVADLKVAFSALLQQNDWMDDYTKEQAANKSSPEFKGFVSHDVFFFSVFQIKPIIPGTPFLKVYLNVRFNGMVKRLQKLRTTFNRSEEYVGSAVVNAFYNRVANSIAFPAGILQSPFYGYGLPPSVNMGAIGSIIGHEITHGFDDAGSQFDFEGNLRNWWTHDTRNKFLERAKCFIDQYGTIVDPQADMNLNGINTQGENIADNGGIREAFRAYRISLAKLGKPNGIALPGLERFTSDQMFFISTATAWCTNMRTQELKNDIQYDTHSPSKYRVNIPMGNLVEFSHAFGCPEGTPMNLTHKCILW